MKNEEDVEQMQEDLQKIYQWGKRNNMEFNSEKFQVIRYGRDLNLKKSTDYFTGDFDEVIERFPTIRDLGVQVSEDVTFLEHIENICKKA